ncbi:hypothetical protein JB92DRAFT_3128342 [Gautieria morchelliformis]|nr:hypothetical protein JB92DRAFT_3128342 [Gautieria morchelliformis]
MDPSPLEMLEQDGFGACITFPRSPHHSGIVDITRDAAEGTIECNIPSIEGTYYNVHVFSREPAFATCEIWAISPMARNELKVLVSRLTPKKSYYMFKAHGNGKRLRAGQLTKSSRSLGSTIIKILEDTAHKPLEFVFNFIQAKTKQDWSDNDGLEFKPARINLYSGRSVGDGGSRVSSFIEGSGSTRKRRIGRPTRLDHDHPIGKQIEKIGRKNTRIASQLKDDTKGKAVDLREQAHNSSVVASLLSEYKKHITGVSRPTGQRDDTQTLQASKDLALVLSREGVERKKLRELPEQIREHCARSAEKQLQRIRNAIQLMLDVYDSMVQELDT